MKQIYSNYTKENHLVWQILFDRQLQKLPNAACSEFLKGLERIAFQPEKIPDFEITNSLLNILTGWKIQAVPGIVDDRIFFELLAAKRFPATTWIRRMDQLEYLEEPDMFHDVFAHVPLLTNKDFCEFLQSLGKIALEHGHDAHAIHLISRIYWFTVEFGLIDDTNGRGIYGAGILSSSGETDFSLSNKPVHLEYNVDQILDSSYRKDIFQSKYFIIKSFEELFKSLSLIRKGLKVRLMEIMRK